MELREFESMAPDHGPTKSELCCIRVGTFVQLSLNSGSRFWAKCTSTKRSNGTFTGKVETGVPGGPLRGDAVVFEKRHVHEVI